MRAVERRKPSPHLCGRCCCQHFCTNPQQSSYFLASKLAESISPRSLPPPPQCLPPSPSFHVFAFACSPRVRSRFGDRHIRVLFLKPALPHVDFQFAREEPIRSSTLLEETGMPRVLVLCPHVVQKTSHPRAVSPSVSSTLAAADFANAAASAAQGTQHDWRRGRASPPASRHHPEPQEGRDVLRVAHHAVQDSRERRATQGLQGRKRENVAP